jgi:hypothetical protein
LNLLQRPAVRTAFSGLRLVRARPRLFVGWALACLGVYGAMSICAMAIGLGRRGGTVDITSQPWMGLITLSLYLVPLIAAGVSLCAVYRAMLRPEAGRFAYIRFGGDELRVIALLLLLALAGFTWAVLMVTATQRMGGDDLLLKIVTWTAASSVVAYLLLRLSFAPVLTFNARRFVLFGSWRATRGRILATFGTDLVVLGLSVALVACAFAIMFVLAVLFGFASVRGAPEATVKGALTFLVILPESIIVTTLLFLLWAAPRAEALREDQAPLAAVFD